MGREPNVGNHEVSKLGQAVVTTVSGASERAVSDRYRQLVSPDRASYLPTADLLLVTFIRRWRRKLIVRIELSRWQTVLRRESNRTESREDLDRTPIIPCVLYASAFAFARPRHCLPTRDRNRSWISSRVARPLFIPTLMKKLREKRDFPSPDFACAPTFLVDVQRFLREVKTNKTDRSSYRVTRDKTNRSSNEKWLFRLGLL